MIYDSSPFLLHSQCRELRPRSSSRGATPHKTCVTRRLTKFIFLHGQGYRSFIPCKLRLLHSTVANCHDAWPSSSPSSYCCIRVSDRGSSPHLDSRRSLSASCISKPSQPKGSNCHHVGVLACYLHPLEKARQMSCSPLQSIPGLVCLLLDLTRSS